MFDPLILENLAAIEAGILIPTCDVRAELAKMNPKEARKAKRRWRKLMRIAEKRWHPVKDPKMSKKAQRYFARRILRERGRKILDL